MVIFKELWWFFKQEKKSYLTGVLFLILVSFVNLVPPYIIGRVVDHIQNRTLSVTILVEWLLLILLLACCAYGFRYLWRIFIFGSAYRLERQLRNNLYQHFTKMSPQFFHKRRIGDLMAHSTNDVQAVGLTAGDGVLTLVDSLATGALVTITMLFINWKLTLIVLLPMPFMALATWIYGEMLHKRFHKAQAAFSDLNDKVQENVSGVRVIKAFGQEKAEIRSFKNLSSDVVNKNIAVAKVDALFDPTISLIIGFSFILAVGFGAMYVVQDNGFTLGELTTFTIYLGHLIWPMLAFGMLFNIMERGRASYDRIKIMLGVKPEILDREDALNKVPQGAVIYKVNKFVYPEQEQPALRNVHFELKQGQTLGVVGKTGSGKTTLLRLLIREFNLAEGDIYIGNQSIYDVTLHALREATGYVPQDHFLFSATIAENIAFGKPDATLEEIHAAAKAACIHDDIMQFTEGYGTIVGERGVTLSGGQKQRISIARALLMNPQILMLDDALSAVDAKTEESILNELRLNRQQQTTFISAHRLSAIEHADLIIVMEDGVIAERGTHDELMKADGWYAEMYRKQQLESDVEEGGHFAR